MAEQAEAVEAGEIAAKTVNNALGTLVVCLNAAVEDGLLAANPALRVQRLPAAHIEREYLRLHEIPLYLDSCSDLYRPLAELLIGSGLRISEALALRVGDLELEDTRRHDRRLPLAQERRGVGSTKSDRFRSVEIGREPLARAPRPAGRRRRDGALGIGPTARSVRRCPCGPQAQPGSMGERRRRPSRWTARPSRVTGTRRRSQDAALRDMPLHALRHTAAAAWLAAGNSLMYVQRQLGHADISTTEHYYGHLERHVLAAGAVGDRGSDRASLAGCRLEQWLRSGGVRPDS